MEFFIKCFFYDFLKKLIIFIVHVLIYSFLLFPLSIFILLSFLLLWLIFVSFSKIFYKLYQQEICIIFCFIRVESLYIICYNNHWRTSSGVRRTFINNISLYFIEFVIFSRIELINFYYLCFKSWLKKIIVIIYRKKKFFIIQFNYIIIICVNRIK